MNAAAMHAFMASCDIHGFEAQFIFKYDNKDLKRDPVTIWLHYDPTTGDHSLAFDESDWQRDAWCFERHGDVLRMSFNAKGPEHRRHAIRLIRGSNGEWVGFDYRQRHVVMTPLHVGLMADDGSWHDFDNVDVQDAADYCWV